MLDITAANTARLPNSTSSVVRATTGERRRGGRSCWPPIAQREGPFALPVVAAVVEVERLVAQEAPRERLEAFVARRACFLAVAPSARFADHGRPAHGVDLVEDGQDWRQEGGDVTGGFGHFTSFRVRRRRCSAFIRLV